jgi:hypothetical protein
MTSTPLNTADLPLVVSGGVTLNLKVSVVSATFTLADCRIYIQSSDDSFYTMDSSGLGGEITIGTQDATLVIPADSVSLAATGQPQPTTPVEYGQLPQESSTFQPGRPQNSKNQHYIDLIDASGYTVIRLQGVFWINPVTGQPYPPGPTTGTTDVTIEVGDTTVQVFQNAVTSVFGRTGDVVAQSGDYDITQISNSVHSVHGRTGVVVAEAGDYALNQITGLTSSGSGANFLADDGLYKPGGLNTIAATQTANYTAAAGELVPCDTNTVGAFTVSLPASPSLGAQVGIKIVNGGTNELTISGNGNTLERVDEGYDQVATTTLTENGGGAEWYFDGTSWFIVNRIKVGSTVEYWLATAQSPIPVTPTAIVWPTSAPATPFFFSHSAGTITALRPWQGFIYLTIELTYNNSAADESVDITVAEVSTATVDLMPNLYDNFVTNKGAGVNQNTKTLTGFAVFDTGQTLRFDVSRASSGTSDADLDGATLMLAHR